MHLIAPPAFHPPSSLLGRLVQRWTEDRRQAESLFIVAVALVLVVAMLAGQWSWVLWGLGPDGSPNLAYFVAQIVGGLIVGGGCLLGWRRPVHVRLEDEGLAIRRGAETLVVALGEVTAAERITADAYHLHWSRYAVTQIFVNRVEDALLLLRTTRGPVVLGLPTSDMEHLEAHLIEYLEHPSSLRLVRAA